MTQDVRFLPAPPSFDLRQNSVFGRAGLFRATAGGGANQMQGLLGGAGRAVPFAELSPRTPCLRRRQRPDFVGVEPCFRKDRAVWDTAN